MEPGLTDGALPVAVLGAGPIGLAAAAHLSDRGVPFVVFEAGEGVGAHVEQWGHVRLFTPWRVNIDLVAARLLTASGWDAPQPDVYPTGADLVDQYLRPLAMVPAIEPNLRASHRVVAVERRGIGKVGGHEREQCPFVVTVDGPAGRARHLVSAVIDATGTWSSSNPLGADGSPAIGEDTVEALVDYGVPDVLVADRARYANRAVAVVGSGHSAQNVIVDMARLSEDAPATSTTWLLRRREGGPVTTLDADALPERERLGADVRRLVDAGAVQVVTGFRIDEVRRDGSALYFFSTDGRKSSAFDQVVAATGFRPDLSFLSELQLDPDPALESARGLAQLIDPDLHSCGTVPLHGEAELRHPEPGFYVLGMKSYGRAPTFLLATGYEQVRSVVARLAGDAEAARRVELRLPSPQPADRRQTPQHASEASDCCGLWGTAANDEVTGSARSTGCGVDLARACGPAAAEVGEPSSRGGTSGCCG